MQNIDCDAFRWIDQHARHLHRLLGAVTFHQTGVAINSEQVVAELQRTRQWLQMAGGLEFVNVQRLEYDRSTWLCSSAGRFTDAHNDLASDYMTEFTRLHYAWSALERLLKVINLPGIPDKRLRNNPYNRAAYWLTSNFDPTEVPSHYACVLRHLYRHASSEPGLRDDAWLQTAFQAEPLRAPHGILLVVGNALRNLPAHGDLVVPDPHDWSEHEETAAPTLAVVAHAPRLASRGLLLSIQMLVSLLVCKEVVPGWTTPPSGWWQAEAKGTWTRTHDPEARNLVLQAHLQPPNPDDQDEDELADT